jgi:hypothetical protein
MSAIALNGTNASSPMLEPILEPGRETGAMLNRSADARGRMNIGMACGTTNANHAFAVAVIDGPYNPTALSHVLANAPTL